MTLREHAPSGAGSLLGGRGSKWRGNGAKGGGALGRGRGGEGVWTKPGRMGVTGVKCDFEVASHCLGIALHCVTLPCEMMICARATGPFY